VLAVDNIGKQYASGTYALRDISLEVVRGSFVSLVGPSGCGKSTLLQIIAGLMRASSGEVRLDGRLVVDPPREAIYVFQQYTKSIFPWRTVLGNVAFGLQHRERLSSDQLEQRCREAIDLVGLTGYAAFYPWQLSGGMQQRVALARALVCRPALLLMDEPFSSVDALTRANLQAQLLRLWRQFELSILFVTHDVDEAVYLSQRVLVLSQAPASILDDVAIDLEYPRDPITTREDRAFLRYRHALLEQILGGRPTVPAI
jgi:NitT/TauT family transport system ATP-binding protein